MASHDERFYPRLSEGAYTTTPCPQAVLDQFKPVKTPADEEAETEAALFSEADCLTIQQAIEAAGIPKAYMIEGDAAPVQTGDITEATHVLLVLPPLLPTALEPFFALARGMGANLNQCLLYAESSYKTYLSTGQLPE
jgi:hypothetical protein